MRPPKAEKIEQREGSTGPPAWGELLEPDVEPRDAERAPEPSFPAVAELDDATRARLSDIISRAISAELGHVRISSIAPPPEGPRASIRAAAKTTGTAGKWTLFSAGALTVVGQLIVWTLKPEYAGPIAQALKIIATLIMSVAGGGTPVAPVEGAP